MGYHLNRLDVPVSMAVPKPMLTEFDIHYRLESCDYIRVALARDVLIMSTMHGIMVTHMIS